MGQAMTWSETKQAHPNEWVAFDHYEVDGPLEVNGTIIAHHPDKKRFYDQLKKIRVDHPHIAVRFTGQLVNNPDIPLLWQISDTK